MPVVCSHAMLASPSSGSESSSSESSQSSGTSSTSMSSATSCASSTSYTATATAKMQLEQRDAQSNQSPLPLPESESVRQNTALAPPASIRTQEGVAREGAHTQTETEGAHSPALLDARHQHPSARVLLTSSIPFAVGGSISHRQQSQQAQAQATKAKSQSQPQSRRIYEAAPAQSSSSSGYRYTRSQSGMALSSVAGGRGGDSGSGSRDRDRERERRGSLPRSQSHSHSMSMSMSMAVAVNAQASGSITSPRSMEMEQDRDRRRHSVDHYLSSIAASPPRHPHPHPQAMAAVPEQQQQKYSSFPEPAPSGVGMNRFRKSSLGSSALLGDEREAVSPTRLKQGGRGRYESAAPSLQAQRGGWSGHGHGHSQSMALPGPGPSSGLSGSASVRYDLAQQAGPSDSQQRRRASPEATTMLQVQGARSASEGDKSAEAGASARPATQTLDAKIVLLGRQGVGKTVSLFSFFFQRSSLAGAPSARLCCLHLPDRSASIAAGCLLLPFAPRKPGREQRQTPTLAL